MGATEYRVDGGDWVRNANTGGASPFATAFTVSSRGPARGRVPLDDNAGNVEATKSVAFAISEPEPGFPVVEAFVDPRTGSAPLLARYSATGFDPDGGTLSYRWEFENGTMFGAAVSRTYTQPGTYTATLTATDDEGDEATKEVVVTVTAPGVAAADGRAGRGRLRRSRAAARAVQRDGHDPDGPAAQLQYAWDFGDGGDVLRPRNPSHTYMQKGTYQAKVTVTDPSGATARRR